MPLKSLVRELKEKRNGSGSMPRRRGRTEGAMVVQDRGGPNRPKLEVRQERWADLPPELLLDIIRRVEDSEVSWPARRSVLGCAAACRSWRNVTKEIIRSPEECGRITFPISLKQVALPLISFHPVHFTLDTIMLRLEMILQWILPCSLLCFFLSFDCYFVCLKIACTSRLSDSMFYQKGTSKVDIPFVSGSKPM